MQLLYRTLLYLYPAEYKAAFGLEMIDSFEQARRASREQGLLNFVQFTTCEVSGLIKGLFLERIAKVAAGDGYLLPRCDPQRSTEAPEDLTAIQQRLEDLIRCMELATAHHDSPSARFYSLEERAFRVRLQRLLGKHNSRQGLGSCA